MLTPRCTFKWLDRPGSGGYPKNVPKAYKTPEYDHLLIAERALVARIEKESIEDKDLAACARVLVAVLDYKRVMRMKPKPKDIDVSKAERRTRSAQATPQVVAFNEPTPPATHEEPKGISSTGGP